MDIIRFLASAGTTIALYVVLHMSFAGAPPLGKFLNPFIGFWQNVGEVPSTGFAENISLDGIQEEVQVKYDDLLVPHVFAQNDHDLYYTQGYVTAANRLFQMELQTYVAAGRISEIIGESEAVQALDREARRIGMGFAAESALKAIMADPVAKKTLEAYCDGVNAYISSLSYSEYPFEYKLLGLRPEAWTPLKSAYLLRYMAKDLNYGDKDFEMTNALNLLGKSLYDTLYPDMLSIQDPIVNGTTDWDMFGEVNRPTKPDTVAEVIGRSLLIGTKDPEEGLGSNNWAVSGKKTRSGHAILCNDPHLGLNLPSIWYAMQLTAPGVNVKGVTLPGAPTVVIGYNDSIAWGQTNARRDLVDWYKITFKDSAKDEYLFDGKWLKTERKHEEIRIKGAASITEEVLYTVHGPVVFDDSSSRSGYAMRWVAHDPSLELRALYQLNRATNYQEYKEALVYYDGPAQNFAFASTSGDIAIRIAGKFPNKWEGQGKFLLDGSDSLHAWQSYIPKEHNVFALNPERNYISSANQHPVDRDYPYYVHDYNYEHYRNRRLNNLLDSLQNIGVDEMKALQNDNYNLLASEALPTMLSALKGSKLNDTEKAAQKLLSTWGYINGKDAEAPIYFKSWFEKLRLLAFDELTSEQYHLPTKSNTVRLIKEFPEMVIFDIDSTEVIETAHDIMVMSFCQCVAELEVWRSENTLPFHWANYRGTRVRHLIRKEALGSGILDIGGGKNILNAVGKTTGPSWRMIVEMDPSGVKAWGVYPGGQSGTPGSPYYLNLLENWVNGDYFDMSLREKNATKSFMKEQSITPR